MTADKSGVDQSSAGDRSFGELVAAAQSGEVAALHSLLEQCRDYLLLIANEDIDRGLKAKLGASDFVQQTLWAAHQNFHQFRGTSGEEFKGWLRQILRNDLNQARRHFFATARRNVDREHRLDDSQIVQPSIIDAMHTPGTDAMHQEEVRSLETALANLPEDYRQVIRLRNWDELPFAEIGRRMNLSEDAARKLWYRAIVKLQAQLQSDPIERTNKNTNRIDEAP
jgi:RNA polymerase sigma-70 factor (ECF subfamily)